MGHYRKITTVTALILLTTQTSPVLSAGFQITPTSDGTVRLLAGSGIVGNELGDMFYNPAGLSLVETRGCEIGTAAIDVKKNFKNTNSSLTIDTGAGALILPSSSGGNDTADDLGFPSSLFCAQPLTGHDGISIGFGLTTPWGLSTTYKNDWIGRYHATESALTVFDLNPAIAIDVSDNLSFGVGLSYQVADVELSRAVFLGVGAPDGFTKIRGDDDAIGYNFGLMFRTDDDLRLGASYRSKLDYDLKGHADIRGTPRDGRLQATAPLTIPEYVHLSAYRKFDRLGLSLGARWTKWARFKEIRLRVAGQNDDVTVQNWRSTWTYSIAFDYQFENVLATAGIGYDESPVTSADLRSPTLPDSRRSHLSIGLSGKFGASDQMKWQVGYNRIFVGETPIRATRPINANPLIIDRLIGEYGGKDVNKISVRIQREF